MTQQLVGLYNYRSSTGSDSVMTAAKDVRMGIEGYGSLELEQRLGKIIVVIELKDFAYMQSIRKLFWLYRRHRKRRSLCNTHPIQPK